MTRCRDADPLAAPRRARAVTLAGVCAALVLLLLATVTAVPRRASAQPHHRPGQPRGFTLAATGDLLIHTPVRRRAEVPGGHDFGPQLAAVAPHLHAADLAVCHLEVPLDPDGPWASYPRFNAPAALADAIREAGWDSCSTASNHSADQGWPGLVRTLDALDAAGVHHDGMYRTEDEAAEARLLAVGPVRVGLVSATYGLNGLPVPGGHAWSVRRIDADAITARAVELRRAGADVVVASLHWGDEYRHAPSAYQRANAAAIMGAGQVDAIIGHHAHVVQPVEWIEGRPVVYGLGNFLSGQRPTPRRDGAIVRLRFDHVATTSEEGHPPGWRVTEVTVQPTWVDDAYRVVPAHADDPGSRGASARRTLSVMGVAPSPSPGRTLHDV